MFRSSGPSGGSPGCEISDCVHLRGFWEVGLGSPELPHSVGLRCGLYLTGEWTVVRGCSCDPFASSSAHRIFPVFACRVGMVPVIGFVVASVGGCRRLFLRELAGGSCGCWRSAD